MNRKKHSKCSRICELTTVWALLAASFSVYAENSSACGDLRNHYGPFDYRTTRGYKLEVVEKRHFTPEVEALIRGSSGSIEQDLSYTLRVFPNHHRGLMSMMRLGQKLKTNSPPGLPFSVECYFVRALQFQADDPVARMIYATFLAENNRASEARHELERVEKIAKDNPFTHYNLGLIYFDIKDYEKALVQAHRAMALGFGRTELRKKLVETGKWRDPKTPSITPGEPARDGAPSVN